MAENVQEIKPPEPPPKPPEVPKPTEQLNRSEAKEHGQPNESQQSAQQDTRDAASSEHAKATNEREPDGLRPTPEFQERLDEHSAAKNEPEGLRPTPEFQERLDAHTAATAERDTASPKEATVGDRNVTTPAGEQAGEHAAARQAAAAERAEATADTAPGEAPRPQPGQDADQPALDNGQPRDPARGTQPPEGARDEPVKASSPDESAAVRQPADQNGTHEQQTRPAETTDESTPPGVRPNGNETDDNSTGPPENGYSGPDRRQHEAQHLDPADDHRDQQQTTPPDNTETDRSAETTARLNELRDEGHGPQRHHDPTNEQLAARMGEPILDPQTGEPLLKDNGHVRAQNHIDPMTGTAVDGVHGGVHRCGDYATRFDSPEDYVAADRFMRQQIGDTGPAAARHPISEVLDSNAHERMTGYYHDPDAAGQLKPVDFTDGTVFALYERLPNGDLNLRTMYVDPAPRNPDQSGGTD